MGARPRDNQALFFHGRDSAHRRAIAEGGCGCEGRRDDELSRKMAPNQVNDYSKLAPSSARFQNAIELSLYILEQLSEFASAVWFGAAFEFRSGVCLERTLGSARSPAQLRR